jgi:hypothetical protein
VESTGTAVNDKIAALKQKLTDTEISGQQTIMAERNLFDEEFGRLEAEFKEQLTLRDQLISAERMGRNNVELILENERKDNEFKLRELLGHVDKLNLNLQMALASKVAAEEKNTTLSDQKKILVKEVKTLRKKVDGSNETISQVKEVNDRLTAAVATLQGQVRHLTAQLAQQSQQGSVEGNESMGDASTEATIGSDEQSPTALDLDEAMQIDTSSMIIDRKSPALPADDKRTEIPEDAFDDDWQNSNPQVAAQESAGRTASGEEGDESGPDGRRMSWGIPGAALMELGWLSNEQRNLIAQRAGLDPSANPAPEGEPGDNSSSAAGAISSGGSIINSIASTLFFAGPSDLPIQSAGGTANTGASGTAAQPSNKRGSYFSSISGSSLLSSQPAAAPTSAPAPSPSQPSRRTSFLASMGSISMFGSTDKKSTAPAISAEDIAKPQPQPSEVTSSASKRRPSDFFDSPLPVDDETQVKDTKLRCLRCGGTVEGPKYSTCKCQIPALTPEALEATPAPSAGAGSASSFGGMFAASGSAANPTSGASQPTPAAIPAVGKMLMPSLGPDASAGAGSTIGSTFSSMLRFSSQNAQPQLSPAELLAKWDHKLQPATRRASTALAANPTVPGASSAAAVNPASSRAGPTTGTTEETSSWVSSHDTADAVDGGSVKSAGFGDSNSSCPDDLASDDLEGASTKVVASNTPILAEDGDHECGQQNESETESATLLGAVTSSRQESDVTDGEGAQ